MGGHLTTDEPTVATKLMKQQGYILGKGLGKCLQGITEPIFPKQRTNRHGIGYSFS